MFVLFVSHNIYLTRDERYALADGESVKVIAPSVPVWFYQFNTSEPATEVFCQYTLTNKPGIARIYPIKSGYKINIPQTPEDYEPPERIPDEEWRKMTRKQQDEWYGENPTPINGELLRDRLDGGAEYLKFQYEFEGMKKIQGASKFAIKQSHQVEIKPIELLHKSLVS